MTISDRLHMNAESLHTDAIVIDTHIDTATHLLWRSPDFSTNLADGHVDIPRLRAGGVDAAMFAVWIDEGFSNEDALKLVLRGIDTIHRTVNSYPDDLIFARNAADVRAAKKHGKIAVLITIEGGRVICDDLGILRMLNELGVCSITLAWGAATGWIDSHNHQRHGGLTAFGREVVHEMQRLNMLVDISHVSEAAFWQVLEIAERPVFASHSSCRALLNHTRNMWDPMIEAMAKNGGVININFFGGFIGANPDTGHVEAPLRKPAVYRDPFDRIAYPVPEPGPPLSRLIDHFNHAISVAGAEHVGIGSDFDGVTQLPLGMEDMSKLPSLTDGLLKAGHSEKAVRAVLGENDLRLFEQTLS
jgi:membrane dipeptidase